MLNEIENAIVALLTEKLDSARKIGVQKGVAGIAQPAVYASVEAGKFERVGQASCKQYLTVYVDIIFASLKDQQARREGINLILEGAIQLLLFNDLGLDIHHLEPKAWRNTTTQEFDEKGLIVYSLELATHYYLKQLDDEAATDLLTVGFEYYLKPGDDVDDASDTVTLGGS